MSATLESPTQSAVSLVEAGESGEKMMAWRRGRRINRVTFAKIANCSERKLATYEKEKTLPPTVRRQLTEAARLLNALSEIIPIETLPAWLKEANPGFDDRTPLEVINSGEGDLLWDMVRQTKAGSFL
jgi:hypothetical protein